MESFYGGQQGFSFVVKRNPAENHDGCFYNVNEINTAAREGVLRYGDYAIVTNAINDYTIEHGDLYRINTQGTAEKVANISHPALSTLISGFSGVHSNPPEGQSVEINFLSEEDSKTANKLKMTWTYVTDSDSQIIGIEIGVAAPRPVVDIGVQQKQIDTSDPLAIASNQGIIQESDNSSSKPFYYNYQIQLPMRSILVSKDINIDTTNLDTGTLCFITSEEKGKWYDTSFFGANGTVSMMPANDLSETEAGSYMGHSTHVGILFKKAIYVTNYSIARILPPKDSNQQWYFCYKVLSEELEPSNINMTGMSNISSVGEDFSLASENESSDKYLYLWIGIYRTPNSTSIPNPKETFKNFQLKVSK